MSYYSSYSDKLRDPRWQKLRLKVFERDGWKCKSCSNDKETLVVHHFVYSKKEPWESPIYELETLCETCHEMRERFDDFLGEKSTISTAFVNCLFWRLDVVCGCKPKFPLGQMKIGEVMAFIGGKTRRELIAIRDGVTEDYSI